MYNAIDDRNATNFCVPKIMTIGIPSHKKYDPSLCCDHQVICINIEKVSLYLVTILSRLSIVGNTSLFVLAAAPALCFLSMRKEMQPAGYISFLIQKVRTVADSEQSRKAFFIGPNLWGLEAQTPK